MEVKVGYKRTEIGVIPEEWKISTVGAEFDIQLGKMLDVEKNQGIPKTYLGNKAVQWNHIDVKDLPYMAMSRADLELFRLRLGDLLVCEGGEVGRAAIWESPIEECYYQKALHRLRPKNGYNVRLMLYLLEFLAKIGFLKDYVTQTSIAHLTKEKLAQVPIIYPSHTEQQEIADALSEVDGLIAAQDRLIAKQRAIKEGAMQTLLTGRTRLPEFKQGWEVRRLGEIGPLQRGFDLPTSQLREGTYPVIYSNGLLNHHFAYKVKAPGVVTGRSGTIGKVTYVEKDYWPHNTSLWVTSFNNSSPKFIYYLYTFVGLARFATGSGVPTLNRNDIHVYEVQVPSLSEQTAIAAVLTEMDDTITAMEAEREKLRAMKEGMLHELLTGQRRLR